MSENTVKITKVARNLDDIEGLVASTAPLHVQGTVNNPGNLVTCILTGPAGTMSKPATMGRTTWSVDFGNQPAGDYVVQASAPGEGTVTLSVTVE
jgi:hypothetical protein